MECEHTRMFWLIYPGLVCEECKKLKTYKEFMKPDKPLSSDAVRALIEEAIAISENHPSKDARFFADKVHRFLSEHFS